MLCAAKTTYEIKNYHCCLQKINPHIDKYKLILLKVKIKIIYLMSIFGYKY